jgi:hypothetical protein
MLPHVFSPEGATTIIENLRQRVSQLENLRQRVSQLENIVSRLVQEKLEEQSSSPQFIDDDDVDDVPLLVNNDDWEKAFLEKIEFNEPVGELTIEYDNLTERALFRITDYHIASVEVLGSVFTRVNERDAPFAKEFPGGAYFVHKNDDKSTFNAFYLTCDMGDSFVAVLWLGVPASLDFPVEVFMSNQTMQMMFEYDKNKITFP